MPPSPPRTQLDALAQSFAGSVLAAVREMILVKMAPLKRQSSDDIEHALGRVVALLRETPSGLPAEKIRAALGMESRELPRILKEGLAKNRLTARGRKRATVYAVVGRRPSHVRRAR